MPVSPSRYFPNPLRRNQPGGPNRPSNRSVVQLSATKGHRATGIGGPGMVGGAGGAGGGGGGSATTGSGRGAGFGFRSGTSTTGLRPAPSFRSVPDSSAVVGAILGGRATESGAGTGTGSGTGTRAGAGSGSGGVAAGGGTHGAGAGSGARGAC